MIRVDRGQEPAELVAARAARLPAVTVIATTREPTSDEIKGYNVAKPALVSAQGAKCCYCEQQVEGKYDDVEHFRPKAGAVRGPGFPTTGYWWLAWTWTNLLLACKSCNSEFKRTLFPLAPGSAVLTGQQQPPGGEVPLLLDPASEDPIDHIQFHPAERGRWRPSARGGSPRGDVTIRTLGLDRGSLLDFYKRRVNERVRPEFKAVRDAMATGDHRLVQARWSHACRRLLRATHLFAALAYDALEVLLPAGERASWRLPLARPPTPPGGA